MNPRAKSFLLAFVLLLTLAAAIGGIAGCASFAQESITDSTYEGALVTAHSGLNGGAIGCGIFGAAGLWGFVKVVLELLKL